MKDITVLDLVQYNKMGFDTIKFCGINKQYKIEYKAESLF